MFYTLRDYLLAGCIYSRRDHKHLMLTYQTAELQHQVLDNEDNIIIEVMYYNCVKWDYSDMHPVILETTF